MKIVKSAIDFLGYDVVNASFCKKDIPSFSGQQFELKPEFSRMIKQNSDEENTYSLLLGVKIGSLDSEDDAINELPFAIDVMVEGVFTLQDVDDPVSAMKVNGVAILFPYLRSIVSMLSTISGINPVVLPTINLVKMFEDENAEEDKVTEENE